MRGYKLELISRPHQNHLPELIPHNPEKSIVVWEEIHKLQQKRQVEGLPGQFLSPIFIVPKADGSWHPVINLHSHNPSPFQDGGDPNSEGLSTSRRLTSEAGSTSLSQCWLRFRWQNRTYQFDTLPLSLSSTPFVFTKLLKLVVAVLRQMGVRSV